MLKLAFIMHQNVQKSSLQAQLFNSDLRSAQRKCALSAIDTEKRRKITKNKCFSGALNKPLIIREHIFSFLRVDLIIHSKLQFSPTCPLLALLVIITGTIARLPQFTLKVSMSYKVLDTAYMQDITHMNSIPLEVQSYLG